MRICLLDPGIEDNDGNLSRNLGDLIIREAVEGEINILFKEDDPLVTRISTKTPMRAKQYADIRTCNYIFVGGTNLLSAEMNKYRQWEISLLDAFKLRDVVLLGVGWWQYQDSINFYTRTILRSVLSHKYYHSVRDDYTKKKLESIGIKNVLNTGCPTMWPLSNLKPDSISGSKSENVLVMITDYAKKPDLDKKLIEILLENYKKVYFWPQGRRDLAYVSDMNFPLVILDRTVSALDDLLHSNLSLDYIGTRLHGGIRCLLSEKRALIIEVDNRAKEIANDTGLPTVKRDDFASIRQWIATPSVTQIKLDLPAINKWREQFKARNIVPGGN